MKAPYARWTRSRSSGCRYAAKSVSMISAGTRADDHVGAVLREQAVARLALVQRLVGDRARALECGGARLALGDVFGVAEEVQRVAGGVFDHGAVLADPDLRAVAAADAQLGVGLVDRSGGQ